MEQVGKATHSARGNQPGFRVILTPSWNKRFVLFSLRLTHKLLLFPAMKPVRTILSGIYLLVMVLLPHLHLVFNSHGEPSVQETACCNHAHGSEEQPNDNDERSANHDSCALCQLLVLAADTPQSNASLQTAFTLTPVFEEPETAFSPSIRAPRPARAPPLVTA